MAKLNTLEALPYTLHTHEQTRPAKGECKEAAWVRLPCRGTIYGGYTVTLDEGCYATGVCHDV